MRSATLAEHRAITAALKIDEHRHKGERCRPACAELRDTRAELKVRQEEERTWFAPGPDAMTMFGGED